MVRGRRFTRFNFFLPSKKFTKKRNLLSLFYEKSYESARSAYFTIFFSLLFRLPSTRFSPFYRFHVPFESSLFGFNLNSLHPFASTIRHLALSISIQIEEVIFQSLYIRNYPFRRDPPFIVKFLWIEKIIVSLFFSRFLLSRFFDGTI